MKRAKRRTRSAKKKLIRVHFIMILMRVLRTISQKDGTADSQNCGGRRDFVLSVPIVPALRVSPLPNSAKIYMSPRAGQQGSKYQRADQALVNNVGGGFALFPGIPGFDISNVLPNRKIVIDYDYGQCNLVSLIIPLFQFRILNCRNIVLC